MKARVRIRPARSGRFASGDRGATTAELAVCLPVVVLLLLAGLAAVAAVGTQLRCLGAARDGALASARGESGTDSATRSAPAGSEITITRSSKLVTVVVRSRTPLVPFAVSATAVAAMEPGEGGGTP